MSHDMINDGFRPRLIPTVIYVVNNEFNLKFGITNGDGQLRLQTHKYDGYSNIALLRINQPILLVKNIENIIIDELNQAGFIPIRGREYYSIEAMSIVIDVIDREIFKWYVNSEPQISVSFSISQIKRLQQLSINLSKEEIASISLDDTLKMLLDTYEGIYGDIK